MTDVQPVSSSLENKRSLVLTEQVAVGSSEIPNGGVVYMPELRWMVDPNDIARPMVFDPDDARWAINEHEKQIRIHALGGQ